MGSVISDVTDAVGLTDHAGAEQARNDASAASAASTAMTKEQLEFQKEQYEEWKAIYGPLQEDLGTYFKNLTGDSMAASQIEAIQAEYQKSQQQIDQQLAQRGIRGSGLEASLTSQNIFQTGIAKATARSQSDQMAAQQKMGFLGLGLGQGSNMLGTQANLAASGAANLMNRSSSLTGQSTALKTTSMDATGSLLGAGIRYGLF